MIFWNYFIYLFILFKARNFFDFKNPEVNIMRDQNKLDFDF